MCMFRDLTLNAFLGLAVKSNSPKDLTILRISHHPFVVYLCRLIKMANRDNPLLKLVIA